MLSDLLLSGASPTARRIFNALAEEPETVAAALVPRVRSAQGSGGSISFLTPADAAVRMATRLGEVLHGGRFFDAQGRRVHRAGQRYRPSGARVQV